MNPVTACIGACKCMAFQVHLDACVLPTHIMIVTTMKST